MRQGFQANYVFEPIPEAGNKNFEVTNPGIKQLTIALLPIDSEHKTIVMFLNHEKKINVQLHLT